ncbi:C25 family cysteine peptidase [Elongatibacter sediminis]|uniref:C25 family cysteine peptidase n=1 Tax=Elongatibacter sediminis TaxID=3119006 RepID=A0AAW9R8I2_9GAMM
MRTDRRFRSAPLAFRVLVTVCGLLLASTSLHADDFAFKIAVTEDGPYRVDFDALGFSGPPPATSRLSLTNGGRPVAFEVEDGGDGRFGPGDSLHFMGLHLAGEHSWFNPWSAENIYLLRLRGNKDPASPEPETAVHRDSIVTRHLEHEAFRTALDAPDGKSPETWFWKRLSHLDRAPFRLALPDGPAPAGIRVALAGLSADQAAAAAGAPQHRVELLVNGRIVASAEWQGQAMIELNADAEALGSAPIPVHDPVHDPARKPTLASDNEPALTVELRVPKRTLPGRTAPVIDVVLLNWIELDYPSHAVADLPAFTGPGGKRRYLTDARVHTPVWIKPFEAPVLRAATAQADYLMIVHPSLREAIAPLSAFHASRGLAVAVIDVEDIYDAFNHGIVSPFAIRDFIRHASEHRAPPAARFVLLVGDASWAVRGESPRPNLIPTLQVQAHDELAASDNGFVTIRGDDWRPDLAIGRIPAGDPDELTAVVRKLLAHARGAPDATWLGRAALISDASTEFQDISNELAADLAAQGLAVSTVFPDSAAGTAHQDQTDLIRTFNEGHGLIHFLGHGGRFVWRTGPPDLKHSSDLFSVTDLQRLGNSDRLPLVLSMTCSSGPFDHPEAGSMAEALLMMPTGGAAGVLAASWRVPASRSFSGLLLDQLVQPGQSIGEAILRAKRAEPKRALVESYNLLGDPALGLRLADER